MTRSNGFLDGSDRGDSVRSGGDSGGSPRSVRGASGLPVSEKRTPTGTTVLIVGGLIVAIAAGTTFVIGMLELAH